MNFMKAVVLGFIAGAIATLTVYETLSWLFNTPSLWTGWPRTSWSKEPVEVLGLGFTIPKLFSAMFWGGVFGAVTGLILGARPTGALALRGLVFGLVGPAVIGHFMLSPVISGGEAFYGGNFERIVPALVSSMILGAATAWLYGFFRYGRLP